MTYLFNPIVNMNFTHETKDGILRVVLEGDLLGANREQELLEVVKESLDKKVSACLVDISKVGYMNSTGLSFLIRLLTRFRNVGGDLVLVKPSEQARKLLVITKLNNIFSVAQDEEDAIQLLKA
ncbi:STAS domain-containing protein [Hugenholtzia roseola]|uniref:STAS domain-containing protein n=1 Tax=Hugenholtzia roseola TaxID=1002 RepID=UPI00040D207A|nr:STAS domain-containing protein [Hugenholtzia roseola]